MARLSPPPSVEVYRGARENRAMFDRIAHRYDLMNRVLTLGLDAGWRRRTVAALRLPPGSLVVDLACGTGMLCNEAQRAGLRCLGVDVAAGMLAHSHTGAPLVRGDILRLPLPDGAVDGAVCGFALRNVGDIPGCLRETARVLRPGGRIGFLEVAEPDNPLVHRVHALYFRRLVPLVGGLRGPRALARTGGDGHVAGAPGGDQAAALALEQEAVLRLPGVEEVGGGGDELHPHDSRVPVSS